MAGKPGRSGPRPGAMNALKNGTKVNMKRLVVGELPSKMIAVQREGRRYRRDLERLVLDVKGEIDVVDSHHIDTASAATVAAGICRWLLRNRLKDMSTADIRGCSSDIVKNKERRDNAVRALELNRPEPDPWVVIDAKPEPDDE